MTLGNIKIYFFRKYKFCNFFRFFVIKFVFFQKTCFYVSLCHFYILWAIWNCNTNFESYEYGLFGGMRGYFCNTINLGKITKRVCPVFIYPPFTYWKYTVSSFFMTFKLYRMSLFLFNYFLINEIYGNCKVAVS